MALFRKAVIVFGTVLLLRAHAQAVPGGSFFNGTGTPGAGPYQLVDNYQPSIFFDKFTFYSSYDPTYGHVQYVNETVATANGYASSTNKSAIIKPDTVNLWPNGGPGRPSVRIISANTYTHGLFIFDAKHLPWGCGTWPAYWLLGPNWPSNGEIDIIEGVNTNEDNTVSLHTSPGCQITGSGQKGTFETNNCDSNLNGNSGCGSSLDPSVVPNNYGSYLNANGGGVYATEWTSQYIRTWFFDHAHLPNDISNGNPDPTAWGEPAVNSYGGNCTFDNHFNNMSIIINIDFCGAWAGQVYSQYKNCPQTAGANSLDSCVDYVGNNPKNLTEAYFEINSIQVYQMPVGGVPATSISTTVAAGMPSALSTNTIPLGAEASTSSVSASAYTGPVSSVSQTSSSATASATPLICPDYNQTTWDDANGQSYTIGCGMDYDGGAGSLALDVAPVVSFEACLEYCDSLPGCLAATFIGGNGAGTCYPKAMIGEFHYDGKTNSGLRSDGAVSLASSSVASTSTSPIGVPSSTLASMPTAFYPSSSGTPIIKPSIYDASSAVDTTPIGEKSSSSAGIKISSVVISTTAAIPSALSSSIAAASAMSVSSMRGSSSQNTRTSLLSSPASSTAGSMSTPTCPPGSSNYCATPNKDDICLAASGNDYKVTCGIQYEGPTVRKLIKRASETSLEDCLNLCDASTSCVAVNYAGTSCTMLQAVTGTMSTTNSGSLGAVRAAFQGASGAQGLPNNYGHATATTSLSMSSSGAQGLPNNYGHITTTSTLPISPSGTTTLSLPSGATVTVQVTTTTHAPPGGSFSSGISGSYYVYTSVPGSMSEMTSSANASLCYTCDLTPTVVIGGMTGPVMYSSPASLNPTCSALPGTGTTTVFVTTTTTTCPPMTCPASGYLWGQGASQSSNIVVTTTDARGSTITYTQIPTQAAGGGGGGGYGFTITSGYLGYNSGGTATITEAGSTVVTTGSTAKPTCPYANDSVFSDNMGDLYYIQCNTAYTDEVLSTQTQSTMADCINACDMYNVNTFYMGSQCLGISFYPSSNEANCQLKAGFTAVYADNCNSAQLLTTIQSSNANSTTSYVTTYISGGVTNTIVSGGSTITSISGGSPVVSTVVSTIGGGGSHGSNPNGYGGGGSGGSGGSNPNGYGGGGSGGPGGSDPNGYGGGGGAGTGVSTQYEVSTFVSNGITYQSTYGYSTVPVTLTNSQTSLVPHTIYGTSTAVSTYVSNGHTILSTYGVTTAVSISYAPQTITETTTTVSRSLVPYTIYGTSTAVSTYVSNGQTILSTYGVTTVLTVSYATVTTTTVSISVSTAEATTTAPGVTVTQSVGSGGSGAVTITEGGGGYITVTHTVTKTMAPISSTSSFSCRTYATNYLNGGAQAKRDKAFGSIFDVERILNDWERTPQPGARPVRWW